MTTLLIVRQGQRDIVVTTHLPDDGEIGVTDKQAWDKAIGTIRELQPSSEHPIMLETVRGKEDAIWGEKWFFGCPADVDTAKPDKPHADWQG